MREVLYIGKYFPRRLLKTVREDTRGKIGFSNHNFEMSLIHGLMLQSDIDVEFVSVPEVYAYPHNNRRIWINSESYEEQGAKFHSVGYFNLTVINRLWKMCGVFLRLINSFRRSRESHIEVIVNTPTVELLLPLHLAKLFTSKKIKTAVVVPDIPAFVSGMDKCNPLKRYVLGYMDKLSLHLANKSDLFILLTEAMTDFFSQGKPHMVMEGIVDLTTMDLEIDRPENRTKNVLYTGTLRKIFGVMDLVDAFDQIDIPDLELRICGSGEAADEIMERAKHNPQIKFYGLVDSRKALELQHEATVLVNPRTNAGEFTKYSFPSKNMEYLLSGNPVIAHKLPGIPDEYDNYIQYPDSDTVPSLAEKIKEVISMSDEELDCIGTEGRKFIIGYKNSKIQTRRILDGLASLVSK